MYDRICIEETCKKPFQTATKRNNIRCPQCSQARRKTYFKAYNQEKLLKSKTIEKIPLSYDEGYGHLQAFMGDKGDVTL